MRWKKDFNSKLKHQIFEVLRNDISDSISLINVNDIYDAIDEMFEKILTKQLEKEDKIMDKKINKMIKDTKKVEKEGKELLKIDKPHDKKLKKCDMMMKKKGKK